MKNKTTMNDKPQAEINTVLVAITPDSNLSTDTKALDCVSAKSGLCVGATSKLVIVIYGNVGSGKTTVSKKLNKLLPEFDYINLDDFRLYVEDNLEYSDLMERDCIAENLCEERLCHGSNKIIFETTRVTKFFQQVERHIYFYNQGYEKIIFFFVYLKISPDVSYKRFTERLKQHGHRQAKFVHSDKYSIIDGIRYFHEKQSRTTFNLFFESDKLSADSIVRAIVKSLKSWLKK